MERTYIPLEQRAAGLELNRVETAIGLGKRAVGELLGCEPIDWAAIAEKRAHIHELRLERNEQRHNLKAVKLRYAPLPKYVW